MMPPRPALVQRDRALGDAGQAADAGADHARRCARGSSSSVGLPAGILDRLSAAAIAKTMNSSIRRWSLGGTQSSALKWPDSRVAARHLPGDLRRQVGDVEGLDRADPGFAGEQPRHTRSTPMPSGVTSPSR